MNTEAGRAKLHRPHTAMHATHVFRCPEHSKRAALPKNSGRLRGLQWLPPLRLIFLLCSQSDRRSEESTSTLTYSTSVSASCDLFCCCDNCFLHLLKKTVSCRTELVWFSDIVYELHADACFVDPRGRRLADPGPGRARRGEVPARTRHELRVQGTRLWLMSSPIKQNLLILLRTHAGIRQARAHAGAVRTGALRAVGVGDRSGRRRARTTRPGGEDGWLSGDGDGYGAQEQVVLRRLQPLLQIAAAAAACSCSYCCDKPCCDFFTCLLVMKLVFPVVRKKKRFCCFSCVM